MRIDLLQDWQNYFAANEINLNESLDVNQQYLQRTVYIDQPLHVHFSQVFYNNLPHIDLTENEQNIVDAESEVQKNAIYEGNHILISHAEMNEDSLSLDALQVPFSVLHSLKNRCFPIHSPIYEQRVFRTGVLAPFITQDGFVFLMQRNDPFQLFSVAAGYIEPYSSQLLLNPQNETAEDLIVYNARKEALEEFLESNPGSQQSRILFPKPKVRSISFRQMKNGLAVMEFIVPIALDCTRSELETILSDNHSQDINEHTGYFISLPINKVAIDAFIQQNLPGRFLYEPILQTALKFK